jgi:hypothetical protein
VDRDEDLEVNNDMPKIENSLLKDESDLIVPEVIAENSFSSRRTLDEIVSIDHVPSDFLIPFILHLILPDPLQEFLT